MKREGEKAVNMELQFLSLCDGCDEKRTGIEHGEVIALVNSRRGGDGRSVTI